MMTDSYCYQLEQNLNQQRTAIERKQLNDFFQLDDEFHQKLAQIADCQLAWDTIENLKATMDRVRYMSLDHVSPRKCCCASIRIFLMRWKKETPMRWITP
jgi:DNA-binding GntR family transcriptional regulator